MRADTAHGEDRSFAALSVEQEVLIFQFLIRIGGISSGAENWHLRKLDLKPHELTAHWIEYLASLPLMKTRRCQVMAKTE